ncbi:MAG: alpha/beta hydrolase, partial [Bacteroidetes bacterium]|nr:alpha/beta hydrolase [Bacteroidota bacterium]
KTAMQFALDYPERLTSLTVVDIGPQAYPSGHGVIFEALKAVPVDQIESRSEAQNVLAEYIYETSIQLFLLKNLKRNEDGSYKWRMHLPAIERHYDQILSAIPITESIAVPSLFVHGTRSAYIRTEDEQRIRNKFDKVEFQTLDAGHWVHAERPKELREVVMDFLKRHV